MNENSFICRFMSENTDTWAYRLKHEYGVNIKYDGAYAIFNYLPDCDFSCDIVQEARGIIIDTERLEVACWPFRKFGNHSEYYADSIDWDSARVLEKVDGSIIKLWYDKRAERWQFSTNGMIRAEESELEEAPGLNFMAIVRAADNFADIDYTALDVDSTYIFELVSPRKRIVIKYGFTRLYHIGTRSNLTGEERICDIGIVKPREYPLNSLADCLYAAQALNADKDELEGEGFVVVDKDWHRVKIKSMDYITRHKTLTARMLSKADCIAALLGSREKLELLCAGRQDFAVAMKYYDFKLEELIYNAEQMCNTAKNLYEEYSGDMRAVAEAISAHKLSFIGFRCIRRAQSGREALTSLPVEKICELIDTYEPQRFKLK